MIETKVMDAGNPDAGSCMRNNRGMRRRLALIALIGVPLAMACDRVSFLATDSVTFRFGFDGFGTPVKGDFVRVPLRHELIEEGRETTLTKRIVCVAGDVLTFDGNAHYCNGTLIDTINVRALDDGTPMPIFSFNGVVPAGALYCLGTHPRSFDSRYLGFFPADKAIKVVPLF